MTDLTAELAEGAVIVECPEPGCDHRTAAYGGSIEHHEDGSHTFSYSRRPLIVDDTFVTVQIPDAASQVILDFISEHEAQLDERLAPFGLSLGVIKRPVFVYTDEVQL